MRRLPVALAVLAAAAVTSPAALAAPCSAPAARRAIVRAPAAAALREVLTSPYAAVAQVLCRDVTRDRRRDMVVTVSGGGTGDIVGWAVLRAVPGGWRLAHVRAGGMHLVVRVPARPRGDIVERAPIYRATDPGCCPSGGYRHRRLRWNGARFVLVAQWRSRGALAA